MNKKKKILYIIAFIGALIGVFFYLFTQKYLYALCFLFTVPILIKKIKEYSK